MNDIIIDFEFTGLPTKIHDPEICQMLVKNITNGKSIIKNFKTVVPMTASAIVCCGGDPTKDATEYFDLKMFIDTLEEVGASMVDSFWGFGIKTDKNILREYGIKLPHYYDIQELLQRSDKELCIALGGRSLEACYYIVTGKIMNTAHGTTAELEAIEALYQYIDKYIEDNELSTYLVYMPWGDYAGVPICEYVKEERRRADGYRFNNSDLLAVSMDHWIEYNEYNDLDDDLTEEEEEEILNDMNEYNEKQKEPRRPRKSQNKQK